MRALVGGAIGIAALTGTVWIAVASATPRPNPGGPYQIYILDRAERPTHHVYAFSVGQRAAAAGVENCVGRRVEDAQQMVADLRERMAEEDETFNVVWVVGEGSRVELGVCGAVDEDDDPEHQRSDSLVVVRDASARQVRRLIQEIHGLPADDRNAMIDALGLNRPTPARR